MSKAGEMADKKIPWSFPFAVAQLPEQGSQQVLETTAEQRAAIAALGNLPAVMEARAELDLAHAPGGQVHVTGRVKARVEQTCVVSLDPVENALDEPVDIMFAPPSQIPVSAKVVQSEEGDEFEIPDPPEPIINGFIDLGAVATEFLFLGLDPYPRKPGAEFVPPEVAVDPEEHPFAALKALKDAPAAPKGKKPGKK
ncbi:YceD family protein [Bradyrhizobium sp. SYSU BS000235]|uniref:YceD family protein n=1 Tax=Bradyrhizobium sp. SYSU BS000235 TaxID=3411332 RepID=UPI003C732C3D